MSVTPSPSESSLYYDALVMQFTPLHPDNNDDGHSQGSNSANPHPQAASGKASGLDQSSNQGQVEEPSIRSLPTEPANDDPGKHKAGLRTNEEADNALGRRGSVRTTRSIHTTRTTPALANGGSLLEPEAKPDVDESLFARSAKAERTLSQRQKDRIAKDEKKVTRKFSKLLKTESTNEKVVLDSALKNLATLQNLHHSAIKREAKAESSHARALCAAQKAEGKFHEEKARAAEMRARAEARCIEERARWEGKEGELRAQQERLSSAKETVKETEIRITAFAREVERLRLIQATDEREREAKITELAGQE